MEAFTPPSPPRGPLRQPSDLSVSTLYEPRYSLIARSPPLSPPLTHLRHVHVHSNNGAPSPYFDASETSRPPSLTSLTSLGGSEDLFGFLADQFGDVSPMLPNSQLSQSAASFSTQAMSMPLPFLPLSSRGSPEQPRHDAAASQLLLSVEARRDPPPGSDYAALSLIAHMARKREREDDTLEVTAIPTATAIPALSDSAPFNRDQLRYAQLIANAARFAPDMSMKKNACAPCHTAKTSCDGRRPCDRCVRLERAHLCVERERKLVVNKKSNKKRKTSTPIKEDEQKGEEDILPTPANAEAKVNLTDVSAEHLTASPVSAPSASSSSSSTSSNESSTFNNVLVAADERELSKAMLRVMQSEQANVPHLLRQALVKRLVPPTAFQALLSYISNSMHPDDFTALLASANPTNTDGGDALTIRLPDGSSMPRVLFTFRKSSLEALPDSDRGVDFPQISVYRLWPIDQQLKKKKQTGAADADQLASPVMSESSASAPPTPGLVLTPNLNPVLSPQSEPSVNTPSTAMKMEDEADTDTEGSADANVRLPSAPAGYFPDPVPGANFHDLSEVDLVIQVNREFERLFGYSQRDMRDLMMREGTKGLYRLYRPDSLYQIGRWLTEACLGHRTEFKAIVHLVNKFKGQTACVLSARFKLDEQGFFESVGYAYCPLPDNWQHQAMREAEK